ncbi:MAG: HAD family hydrolase [Candidatus Manganitrophus sp.]|nr:HAD family hydrolase [Candidatus Manganitrophus sp.]
MLQANVIATSGRAVEAAGDVDVLLLDKTGTITLGNRQAAAFLPAPGVTAERTGRRGAARLAGRRDAGRPQHRRAGQATLQAARARDPGARRDLRPLHRADPHERRRSARRGADPQGRRRRDRKLGRSPRRRGPADVRTVTEDVARRGGTPLVVADGASVLGVIELKDIVKGGIKERFAELRRAGASRP